MAGRWRGPVWLNYNYMVALALLTQNASEAAFALVRSSLNTAQAGQT